MGFQRHQREYQGRLLAERRLFSAAAATRDDDHSRRNSHLLALGFEEENLYPLLRGPGGGIDYFGERGIPWHRTARSGDRSPVASSRGFPTRNLASSQVACANFLLPLASHRAALMAALRTLDVDVQDVLPIEHQGRMSLVELEWVGAEQTLEPLPYKRGANRTSTDAFVLARIPGGRRAYLLEWKYVEEGEDEDKGEGTSGDTRRERYGALFRESGLFRVDLDEALHEPVYQLMRFLLLGYRMKRDRELGVTDFRVVVVCPTGNETFRWCAPAGWPPGKALDTLEQTMKERVLSNPGTFAMTSQRALLDAIRAAGIAALEPWVRYHEERYRW